MGIIRRVFGAAAPGDSCDSPNILFSVYIF